MAAEAPPPPQPQPQPWLAPCFQLLLEQGHGDQQGHETEPRQQDLEICAATGPNENFLSRMHRVRLRRKGGPALSLVVKAECPLPLGELPSDLDLFATEGLVLGRVLPRLAGVPPVGPRLLSAGGAAPNRYLIMEDLRAAGLRPPPPAARRSGLDLAHCRLAARALARLHGVAAPRARADPELGRLSFLGRPGREDLAAVQGMTGPALRGAVLQVEQWQDGELYLPQLRELESNLALRLGETNAARSPRFDTLLHGDVWTNNFMFRYAPDADSDRVPTPVDVRLVDFQFSHVGTLACDLNGFLYSAPSDDVLWSHLEELTALYHAELSSAWADAERTGPSSRELREELRRRRAAALFGFFAILPAARQPEGSGGLADPRVYATEEFGRLLRAQLPRFEALGWLRLDPEEGPEAAVVPAAS